LKRIHPHWSSASISTATTFLYLSGAVLLWFVGSAFNRFGLRRTILAGMAAMAVGAGALPFIDALWQLYAAFLVLAAGWSTMSITGVATIIASRFDERRGMALSLALNGASCAGIVISPAMLLLSQAHDFRTGVLAVVAAMILVLTPLVWFSLAPDRRRTGAADAAAKEAAAAAPDRFAILRSLSFWSVTAPFSMVLVAQVGFVTHQVAFLAPRIGAAEAALAVALTTGAAVAGRLSLGLVIDRLNQRMVSAAAFLLQAAAFALMASTSDMLALYTGCIAFGLNVGNVITLPPLIVQREFPPIAYAVVVGMVSAATQFASAFGPALLGLVRDLAGGYGQALMLCVLLNGIASVLVLLRRRRRGAAQVP